MQREPVKFTVRQLGRSTIQTPIIAPMPAHPFEAAKVVALEPWLFTSPTVSEALRAAVREAETAHETIRLLKLENDALVAARDAALEGGII